MLYSVKIKLLYYLIFLFLASLKVEANVIGCDSKDTYSGILRIEKGPTTDLPVLIGTEQEFKAYAKFPNDRKAYWSVWKKYSSGWGQVNWMEYEKDIYEKSTKYTARIYSSGNYMTVVRTKIDGKEDYCNNRQWYVQKKPTASASHSLGDITDIDAGLEIQFTGKGWIDQWAAQMSLSYSWDFGDGTTSTEKNPVHTYKIEGDYTVKLQTYDGNYYSDNTVIATFHVSGPPRNVSNILYEFGACDFYTRTGLISWEDNPDADDYQVEELVGSGWQLLYQGRTTARSYNSSDYGIHKLRIRSGNYFGFGEWKEFEANVPSCSGTNPPHPF
ncbi:PKD domain-containing protein [Aliikangiella sp. G2MR2-5]|uniref:PKD domain-containing protein n=1 Tax=Aliikangiella sp. G2MR2-5 TaxID=2788943 RepID=UPI0018AB279D|nr:PKD domain-containing protein [Aliikangiella sp. G2MR2-5]